MHVKHETTNFIDPPEACRVLVIIALYQYTGFDVMLPGLQLRESLGM
jgi:hypothetical protein